MNSSGNIKEEILKKGFAVVNKFYSDKEVIQLIDIIERADTSASTFRKTAQLFAIRQFLKEVPLSAQIIFNKKLKDLISLLFGNDFFVVKSIYFDKPPASNWFVSYHQDLTISVNNKIELKNFGPWTIKQNQFAVQPPLEILQDNFTIRIHLDDTDEKNGALKVIPHSHTKGIYKKIPAELKTDNEDICCVEKGGIMFMKPLLLHSSGRTTNNKKRRVIHIEFSRFKLPEGLDWSEFLAIN